VMIEGRCFRATAGGAVEVAGDDREVPFALVTRFTPDQAFATGRIQDIGALHHELDRARPSENIFAGIEVDGRFDELMMRAACPAREGEGLVAATEHQSEFTARDVDGTLVGFWAPDYTRAISVPGYHLHFVSSDRTLGGHVLDVKSGSLNVQMQLESEVHLAIPETEDFLTADLGGDHRRELEVAETGSSGSDRDE
jgi:acetolactate decarboxylase